MQALELEFAKEQMPYAQRLNSTAANILWDSIGSTQVDFNTLNNQAQQQISDANAGLSGLISANNSYTANANNELGAYAPQYAAAANTANTQLEGVRNGVLPSAYQENMQNAIRSGIENTMGSNINSLGQRGVLNSSVTSTAMNDISRNAADTMAQQYQQNLNAAAGLTQQQLGNTTSALDAQMNAAQQMYGNQMAANETNAGLFGSLLNSSGTAITTGAAAQEAAQQPALNLWNASVGLTPSGNGALSAVAGKGTQTTTNAGGNNWLNGAAGLIGGIASAWCFAEDTLIKMTDGTAKFIQDVVKGDKVLCPNKDGTESEEEVLEVMEPHFADVYSLTAKDFNDDYYVTFVTPTQPLLCADGTFCKVGNLKLMKELRGGLIVQSIEYDEFAKVYDLKVSGENNYYADGFAAKGGTNEW